MCFKYWMYKLRTLSNDSVVNFFVLHKHDHHSRLQADFTSYLTIAASVPNTLALLMNTYLAKKYKKKIRNY